MLSTRLFGSILSPAGARGALSILIFHRVLARPDPLYPDEPDAQRFDMLLGWLARSFKVMPLEQATRALAVGKLPARAAAITFDDGYRDNFTVAMPLLRKHGLTATFFIASSFLDGGRMWNDTVSEAIRGIDSARLDLSSLGLGVLPTASIEDKRLAIRALLPKLKYLSLEQRQEGAGEIAGLCGVSLPNDLMMDSEHVKGLREAGMSIGAHTQNHPILARLDEKRAYDEIVGSKKFLEGLLGAPVPLFAYPNGRPTQDYTRVHVDMVRAAGFEAAVSTSIGAARSWRRPDATPALHSVGSHGTQVRAAPCPQHVQRRNHGLSGIRLSIAISFAALLIVAPALSHAQFVLSDERSGMTCAHYQASARLAWLRAGGDWQDVDGVSSW
jgi:peptidoglycan/xylan/chitin deacetylase (PgdA/CDA1 family)